MKMKRSQLVKIVREELTAYLGGLLREKEGDKPELADAEKDKKPADDKKPDDQKMKPQAQPDNKAGKPTGKKDDKPVDAAPPEQPPVEDPEADDELEKDAAGEDDEEGDEADIGDEKKVSDELVGKTIQSITANPKSKLMPGAQEITIQFDQIPEPLKILISKSGAVKYYFKGLHNEI